MFDNVIFDYIWYHFQMSSAVIRSAISTFKLYDNKQFIDHYNQFYESIQKIK